MIIRAGDIKIRSAFRPSQGHLHVLANDSNCQRSFLGKTFSEVVTPASEFYAISAGNEWAGAFLLDEPDITTGAVCMHILIREGWMRPTALTATKLAAFMARLHGLIPFTTVLTDPTYDYMRKFLADCGFVHHLYKDNFEVITTPANYIPSLPSMEIFT